jgi:hypothetical protein
MFSTPLTRQLVPAVLAAGALSFAAPGVAHAAGPPRPAAPHNAPHPHVTQVATLGSARAGRDETDVSPVTAL